MADPIDILNRSTQQTAAILRAVGSEQMKADSPCAGWTVRDVANHSIAAMKMFTEAIDKGSVDAEALFSADHVGASATASFEAAAADVVERFRGAGVLGSELNLPFGTFPATVGLGLITNDVAVHGWDIARATGQSPAYDDAVTDACSAFAHEMFANPAFRGDSFAAEQPVLAGASKMDALAAYLGRS